MNNQPGTHDEIDKQIIAFIQNDIPLETRPFKPLAEKLGISEDEIINRIHSLKSNTLIRRFGAVLRHQQAGYKSNAMVAWRVNNSEADRAGQTMAGFEAVSHCYLRETPAAFQYNLFTMVHARSEKELSEIIDSLSQASGLTEYTILKSRHEFKKTSMTYF